jgi:hypothetical protein
LHYIHYGAYPFCNIRYGFYPINTHINHPCKFRKLTYPPPQKNDPCLPRGGYTGLLYSYREDIKMIYERGHPKIVVMVETTGEGSGGVIHTKVFRCSPDASRMTESTKDGSGRGIHTIKTPRGLARRYPRLSDLFLIRINYNLSSFVPIPILNGLSSLQLMVRRYPSFLFSE